MRRLATIAVLLAVGACSDSTGPATTAPPAAPTTKVVPGPTTSSPAHATTSVAAPPPTAAPTTTSSLPRLVEAPPALPDGRPATFVAVTDDFRAVEVDTVTGAVVAVFGQMSAPEELDAAGEEAAFEIVIDAIWRTGATAGSS